MGSEHQARIKCETKEGSINFTNEKQKTNQLVTKKMFFWLMRPND